MCDTGFLCFILTDYESYLKEFKEFKLTEEVISWKFIL